MLSGLTALGRRWAAEIFSGVDGDTPSVRPTQLKALNRIVRRARHFVRIAGGVEVSARIAAFDPSAAVIALKVRLVSGGRDAVANDVALERRRGLVPSAMTACSAKPSEASATGAAVAASTSEAIGMITPGATVTTDFILRRIAVVGVTRLAHIAAS